MSGQQTPPDPLEGQWADVEMVREVVMAEVDHCIWTATGGTDGCAQCSNRSLGINLTFAERIARGHLECAEELAVDKGARGVKYGLGCGGLNARLFGVLTDPRLGQWKRHLDEWSRRV